MEPLELTPEILLKAYAIGVFPMAEDRDDPDIFWLDPRMRGVLPMDDIHIPRRLQKTLRSSKFEVTFNQCFEQVIDGCSEETEKRPQTWINDTIYNLYTSLYHMGHAHSVEVWSENRLVGGLYGVALGGAFFGESMFSKKTDASKVALMHLIARLQGAGFTLLDTQFVTKHLSQFGAMEIPRDDYRKLLNHAITQTCDFLTHYHAGEIKDFLINHKNKLKAKT